MKTSYTLFNEQIQTGISPSTNIFSDISHCNIFYHFSGQNSNSSVTFNFQVADPAGNYSYTLDTQTLTGIGQTGILATLPSPTAYGSSPLSYGCRGIISNITSGNASMFVDLFRG